MNHVADSLRAGLPAVPRRLAGFWIVAIVMLVAIPVALNAARTRSYSASVEAFPIQHEGFAPVTDRLAYVTDLLRDPLVPHEIAVGSGLAIGEKDVLARISAQRTPRSVLLSARADTPDHAVSLVDAAAAVLANASARRLGAELRARVARLARAASADRLDAGVQVALARARADAASFQAKPLYGLAIGPRPRPPAPQQAVDRLVGYLPGPLPPRHSAATAALSGLVIALLICAVSYAFWVPRRERD
jgi:hypothetical protein